MGRLRAETLSRVEQFAHRMLDVAEELSKQRRFSRIVDQISGCGTSVGANIFEADQAMSSRDFARAVAIAVKEASECRFWLRCIASRAWIAPQRLEPLLEEVDHLMRMFNAMVKRTRAKPNPSDRRSA